MPKIVEADILDFANNFEGEKFHALLSDPPYALISISKRFGDPDSAPALEGQDGRFTRLSKGFMGQPWDSFESLEQYREWVESWAKALIENVLRPGAVCLFFGGTRTWHHLGVALENGGFEIYDTLMWLYGQGFPKSHQIEDWPGFGTSLKPAWEPILLCRAPRGDITFDDLAAQYGSGALNIDGSRIDQGGAGLDVYDGSFDREGRYVNPMSQAGRWPANLLLEHHEKCVKVGSTTVPGRVLNRYPSQKQGGSFAFYAEDDKGKSYESEQMPDELIDEWACVSECPIRQLNDQVGQIQSGMMAAGQRRKKSLGLGGYRKGFPDIATQKDTYGDRGGPSRFFYCGKALPGEKNQGCSDFYWRRGSDGYERISQEEWESADERRRARGNIHPTVKPLGLLRYLATMIKPPDDIGASILVPFSGSGSEMIAAYQAGWREIVGIEISPNYNEIARARIAGTIGMF